MTGDRSEAAVLLAREAAVVAEILDPVAAAAGPATWQGPAADQFEHELEARRRLLRAVADQLRGTATRVLAEPVTPAGPVAPTGVRASVA